MEPDWKDVCVIIVDQIRLMPLQVLYALYTILNFISLHGWNCVLYSVKMALEYIRFMTFIY